MKTCVLIPAYNEEKTIGLIIDEIKKQGLSTIVIDDGSVDKTAVIAKEAGAIVLKNDKNKGKGASLRNGFKYVLNTDWQAVITMDGDSQHSAKDIPKFIAKAGLSKKGIIIGNRMCHVMNMPLARRLTNRFMSFLISAIIGQKIADTQCGYRLIKKPVLEKIRLTTSKYETDSEILIEAGKNGFEIESVEIQTIYQREISRIQPLIDTLRFIKFLIKIIFKR